MVCLLISFVPQAQAETPVSESGAISKSILMLGNVFGINLFKYQVSVAADTTDKPAIYGGLTREIVTLNLESDASQIQGSFFFVNDTFTYCTVSPLQGSISYINPLAADTLGKTSELLQRYQSNAETKAATLQDSVNLLKEVPTIESANKTAGALSLKTISKNGITNMAWSQHLNGVDFPTGLQVHINGESIGITDFSNFAQIGSTNIALSEEQATQVALASAKKVTLNVSQADGSYKEGPVSLIDEPCSISLDAAYREPFTEYPLWQMSFLLVEPVGYTVGVQVAVWADTGKIWYCQSYGFYGTAENEQPTVRSLSQGTVNQQLQMLTSNQLAVVVALVAIFSFCSYPILLKSKNKKLYFRMVKVATPILLCLLCFSSVAGVMASTKVGMVWGTPTSIIPNCEDQEEDGYRSSVTEYIAGLTDAPPDWQCDNSYGEDTTTSNICNNNSYVNSSGSYDFIATFHVGDFLAPIGTCYRTYPSGNSINDTNIASYTGYKNHFTFLWVCTQAELWQQDGQPHLEAQAPPGASLSYINPDPNHVGMPYAWTHNSGMSLNGYAMPDSGAYCYISFHNASMELKNVGFSSGLKYANFVESFYSFLYNNHLSVNAALDAATLNMNDPNQQYFSETELYTGYWGKGMSEQYDQWSSMRVFGNGNLVVSPVGDPNLVVIALGWNGGCWQWDVTNVYIDEEWVGVTGAYGMFVLPLTLSTGYHTVMVNDSAYGGDFQCFGGYNLGENSVTFYVPSELCLTAYYYPGYTLNITDSWGGSTAPSADLYPYSWDSYVNVTACPWGNYSLDHWVLDGANGGSSSLKTVHMDQHHSLQAVFSYGPVQYSISASADAHCSISPSGEVLVTQGGNQAFTISGSQGYEVEHVYVDSEDQGALSNYTFSNVQCCHTISVTSVAVPANYTMTVQSVDDGTSWPVPTDVYLDDEWVGEIYDCEGVSFSVSSGDHTIEVADMVWTGYPDLYWWFSYFDTGTGGNPTTISVSSNLTVTAHYYNGY